MLKIGCITQTANLTETAGSRFHMDPEECTVKVLEKGNVELIWVVISAHDLRLS